MLTLRVPVQENFCGYQSLLERQFAVLLVVLIQQTPAVLGGYVLKKYLERLNCNA
jgi:hypothetical protein